MCCVGRVPRCGTVRYPRRATYGKRQRGKDTEKRSHLVKRQVVQVVQHPLSPRGPYAGPLFPLFAWLDVGQWPEVAQLRRRHAAGGAGSARTLRKTTNGLTSRASLSTSDASVSSAVSTSLACRAVPARPCRWLGQQGVCIASPAGFGWVRGVGGRTTPLPTCATSAPTTSCDPCTRRVKQPPARHSVHARWR